MNYIVEVHENEDPNGVRFWGTVPDIPGCNIAEETLDEFRRSAADVVHTIIELSAKSGIHYPTPTSLEFRLMVPV